MVNMAIRISSAGACPRRVQLEAWNVEGLPLWEGTERAFAEGSMHEQSILQWACENIPGTPYVLHSEQLEVSIYYRDRKLLVGHIDGLATNNEGVTVLLEAKALAKRSFEELRQYGLKNSHPQYYTQIQLYLHALGLEKGFLVARNKETPKTRLWDHHFEEVTYDPAFVEEELKRIDELMDKIELQQEIEPPFNPEENWQCRPPWCPYTNICFPEYYEKAIQPKDWEQNINLESTVEEYETLGDEIKELQQRRDELKEVIMSQVKGEALVAGKYLVTVKERSSERIDTKLARQVLPAEMLQELIKVTKSKVLEIKELSQ